MNELKTKIHIKKPSRSYSGEMWKTNKANKKRLALDFNNRCGYCGDSHDFTGGFDTFHVEHFVPKEKFSSHQFLYENLIYSCPICNIAKSDKWSGTTPLENIVDDTGFIDPCESDYDSHLYRLESGAIYFQTNLGKYMYKELKLYLDRHRLIYNLSTISESCERLKEKIDFKEQRGENAETLRRVYSELQADFFDYFKDLSRNL